MKWTNQAKTVLSTTTFTQSGPQRRRGRYNFDLGYLSRDVPPCMQSFLANSLSFSEEKFLPWQLIDDFKKAEEFSECILVVWDCQKCVWSHVKYLLLCLDSLIT